MASEQNRKICDGFCNYRPLRMDPLFSKRVHDLLVLAFFSCPTFTPHFVVYPLSATHIW
jgi:hypothetical protein